MALQHTMRFYASLSVKIGRWRRVFKLRAAAAGASACEHSSIGTLATRREEGCARRQNPTKKDVLAKIDGVDALVVGLTLALLDSNAATTLTTR